mmetsp:Transcript_85800/g.228707  ORF Transcript_85800/g.228707 Transcript_85800/m.228707 type:complete len:413 (-) Transcript_85800:72-1310(-)
MVAPGGEDGLEHLVDVLLGHEAQVVRHAREGRVLVVGAAHAAAHQHVVALERLAVILEDYHQADVVDVDVHRVVARHRHRHLELLGEIGAAVEGLRLVARDDALAVIVVARLGEELLEALNVLVVAGLRLGVLARGAVNEVLLPVLDGLGLLAVEPELRERRGRGLEELRNHVGHVEDVVVRGVVDEGSGRRHDVTVDVTAAAEGGGASVGESGDDSLEVMLAHAVDLEGLAGGGADVVLSVLGGKVINDLVHLGGHLAGGHLETEHELERLLVCLLIVTLQITILLHIAAVGLEQNHSLVSDRDNLEVLHLLVERVQIVVAVPLGNLDIVLRDLLGVISPRLQPSSRVSLLLRMGRIRGTKFLARGKPISLGRRGDHRQALSENRAAPRLKTHTKCRDTRRGEGAGHRKRH